MSYEQTIEWQNYCELMKRRPYAFRNIGNIDIITDINQVESFVEETGKKIGVLYKSEYNLWVVDLVKGRDGICFAYERLLPAVETGAVITIPRYEGKYILLRQYRHALRDYQYAFPRGFGENGIASEKNVGKELAEELGVTVKNSRFLGRIIADSGLSGNQVDVFVCDISKPQLNQGYEGIENVYTIDKFELKQWIIGGKITDGFSLAAWALLEETVQSILDRTIPY